MSATNIMEFTADLKRFGEIVRIRKKEVVQKVVLDLWRGITYRTPRRTGRAAANWFVSENEPSTRIEMYEGQTAPDSIAIPPPPDVSSITGDNAVYIINNLPYIEPLEHGHSKRAPNGMVRLTIQDVSSGIDRVIAAASATR